MNKTVLVLAALVVATAVAASAESVDRWDQPDFHSAHPAIVAIAERLMSPRALAAARALVPNLQADAGWADRILFTEPKQPWSSPYHFINLPNGACGYEYSRDCKDKAGVLGGCVDGAIQNYTAQLANTALPTAQRADALRFVLHFIGDIHAPLHVGNGGDWGGNKITCTFLGATNPMKNLHAIWDADLIKKLIADQFGGSVERFVDSSVKRVTAGGQWQAMRKKWVNCGSGAGKYRFGQCSALWASESAKLACAFAYVGVDGKTPIADKSDLTIEYYRRVIGTVEQQLVKAGTRLANVLTRVFEAAAAPAKPKPTKSKPARK